MSAFHEVNFPFSLALGAVGGPERRTEIIQLASGREARNTPWCDSRRHWDAGPGLRSLDDLHRLTAFYEARRGPLHGFRFRDPLDHRSCDPSRPPRASDQRLGEGDGALTRFALIKAYESGGSVWERPIRKPILASLVVAVDGLPVVAEFDEASGEIVLAVPPVPGQAVTAGFQFDCPVRFASDRLEISLDHVGAGTASIPLVELRL